ncbi:MAG TPA: Wzz/FepE/Etk N-terminal domain-containing protein [Bacillota bacterium]
MDQQDMIDLREYFAILRRRLWAIILVTVVAVATSGIISYFFIEPVYSASTTLMVLKKDTPVDYTTLLMNRQLVKTYGEIAKSRTVAEHVIADMGLGIPVSSLQAAIHVSPVKDTEIIQVSVEDTAPAEAASIANAVARDFIKQVIQIMKVENVQVVDPAIEPTTPIKPRPKLNMAVAGVLGVMVGVGLAFVLEYLDNTVKSPEDVRRFLDLPVLGTIPVIDLRHESKMAKKAADREAQGQAADAGDGGLPVIKRAQPGQAEDRGLKAVR